MPFPIEISRLSRDLGGVPESITAKDALARGYLIEDFQGLGRLALPRKYTGKEVIVVICGKSARVFLKSASQELFGLCRVILLNGTPDLTGLRLSRLRQVTIRVRDENAGKPGN